MFILKVVVMQSITCVCNFICVYSVSAIDHFRMLTVLLYILHNFPMLFRLLATRIAELEHRLKVLEISGLWSTADTEEEWSQHTSRACMRE